ncbi:16S rRNA (uracil(1498)-N(3))-methyltransferase [Rhodobacteraceae bacterium CCMM004]|nr:16S rRNA (uracil(1498)-N(3))-methyltransferase [Rhodobacteraceae bacterium CCMM004]
MSATIRLHVEHDLAPGQAVPLTQAQARYLFAVMRLGVGDGLRLFNSRDGEFAAEVAEAGKRGGALAVGACTAPLRRPPDLWLLFAPIKKTRTDFIVEKAAELGAARICPVQTDHTNAERIRRDRLQAHAVEAAEQCGGTFVPEVADLAPLRRVLDRWPAERRLLFCDETRAGAHASLAGAPRGPWAVLIGPEGGFSDRERGVLGALPQAWPVALGPRILRADTAAVAALAMWQAALGDWG